MSFSVPFSFETKTKFCMKETGSFIFRTFFAISQDHNYFFGNGEANHFFLLRLINNESILVQIWENKGLITILLETFTGRMISKTLLFVFLNW